jgi:hypothetical protein
MIYKLFVVAWPAGGGGVHSAGTKAERLRCNDAEHSQHVLHDSTSCRGRVLLLPLFICAHRTSLSLARAKKLFPVYNKCPELCRLSVYENAGAWRTFAGSPLLLIHLLSLN